LLTLAVVAILVSLAYSSYERFILRSRNAVAAAEIQTISGCLDRYVTSANRLPPNLATAGCGKDDPWGNPYQYCNIDGASSTAKRSGKGVGGCEVRKDKDQHPLNSDYDLYSMGADGRSVAPLTAQASHDDIIRARNGAFLGLGADY
jgi:general secretion pathway protein G